MKLRYTRNQLENLTVILVTSYYLKFFFEEKKGPKSYCPRLKNTCIPSQSSLSQILKNLSGPLSQKTLFFGNNNVLGDKIENFWDQDKIGNFCYREVKHSFILDPNLSNSGIKTTFF